MHVCMYVRYVNMYYVCLIAILECVYVQLYICMHVVNTVFIY